MQSPLWRRDFHSQGGPIAGAAPRPASQPEPVGPYCLLPLPGVPQPIPPRPAPASPGGPILAWDRSHGDS
ncbi:MAG: hypothetical protein WCO50_03750 [Synechococcus sp. ELA619]